MLPTTICGWPRDPGPDRFRAAVDRRHRRAQPPGQEHPGRDPVDRDAHVAPRLRHGRLARSADRPHPWSVERGHVAQRKPVAGYQAQGLLKSRTIRMRPHRRSPPDISVSARATQSLSLFLFESMTIPTRACRGRQAPAHRRQLGSRARSRMRLQFRCGRVQRQRGDAAGRQRFRPDPARPRPPEAMGGTTKRYFAEVTTSTNSPRRSSLSSI